MKLITELPEIFVVVLCHKYIMSPQKHVYNLYKYDHIR